MYYVNRNKDIVLYYCITDILDAAMVLIMLVLPVHTPIHRRISSEAPPGQHTNKHHPIEV